LALRGRTHYVDRSRRTRQARPQDHHQIALRQRDRAGTDPPASDRIDRGGRGPVLLSGLASVVGSLFDEPGGFDRDALAEKLRTLADQNICIGGSSWEYEGW